MGLCNHHYNLIFTMIMKKKIKFRREWLKKKNFVNFSQVLNPYFQIVKPGIPEI